MLINKSVVPSVFTVMNMFVGYLSVIQAMNGKFWMASWLIILAGIFDALDGKIARKIQKTSDFGTELDSLADVISFGIAPSILIFRAFSDTWVVVGALIAFMPLLFGALRLARFNADTESQSKSFIGLPIPAAAVTLASFVIFNEKIVSHDMGAAKFVVPLVIFLSLLMVSNVPFDKFPSLSFKAGKLNSFKLGLFIFFGATVLYFQGYALFPWSLLYILYRIMRWTLTLGRHEESEIAESTFRE